MKIQVEHNEQYYNVYLDENKKIEKITHVKENKLLINIGLGLLIFTIVLFVYDWAYDHYDNVRGLTSGNLLQAMGFTRKNMVRTVGKFITLFVSLYLLNHGTENELKDAELVNVISQDGFFDSMGAAMKNEKLIL